MAIAGVVSGQAPVGGFYVNSPRVKWLVVKSEVHSFEMDSEQVRKDNAPVFTGPPGFQITAFNVAYDRESILLGVLLDNGKTRLLKIHNESRGKTLLIKDMTPYQPWEVQFADIDDDGEMEICLGVYKESPLHPVMTRRLFIFSFDYDLRPKWRGSRLSKPLVDFLFYQTPGQKTRLISTELTRDGRQCLNIYGWDQFGFTGLGDYHLLEKGEELGDGYVEAGDMMIHRIFIIRGGKPFSELPPWMREGLEGMTVGELDKIVAP